MLPCPPPVPAMPLPCLTFSFSRLPQVPNLTLPQGSVACTPPPGGYGHAPRTDVPAWLLSPPAGPPPTLVGQDLPAASAPGAAGPSPGPYPALPQRPGVPASPAFRLPTKLPGGKPSSGPAAASNPSYPTPKPPCAAPPSRAAGPPRFPVTHVPAATSLPTAGQQRDRDHRQSAQDSPSDRKPHAPSAGPPVSACGTPAPSPARARLTPGRLVLPAARPAPGPGTPRAPRRAPGPQKLPWLMLPGERVSDAPAPALNLALSTPMPTSAAAAWPPHGSAVAHGHHVGVPGMPW